MVDPQQIPEASLPDAAAMLPLSELQQLTIEQQGRLAQSVSGDFRRWKQSRAALERTWQDCWQAYLCDENALYATPDEATPDRSRIARPVLYEAVEAIHSNLLNALFPANEKFFSVTGKTESDHQQSQLIEEFIRGKLEDLGFFEKYSLFLKQAIITGNTVAAVPWRRKTRKRRIQKPVALFGLTVGYSRVEQEELVCNGPDFQVIDMFDFCIDPNEPDFEKARVIRKIDRSLRELQASPIYSNLENLQGGNALADTDDSHKASRRRSFGIEDSVSKMDGDSDKITLLEAWGDFNIDDVLYENYVCVVANGSTVIRFEPNPYDCGLKPFVFTGFIPVPNEVYGIGAIEKSLGLQHAINTLTNQKLDVINISINNPFTYLINDDAFDPESVITRPGALIPVKSHDTLRPIQYLNNFTVAFNEIADLKTEAQEATGAFKYFTGADSDPLQRTATEVNALVSGGAQKFSSFLAHLEHTSLEPFLRIVFEHARQFVNESENMAIPAPNGEMSFLQIPPDLLKQTECRFAINGSKGLIAKNDEIAAMAKFLELVQNDPELRRQVDILAMYKKIYRRLGFKDEAEIFRKQLPVPSPQQPPKGGPA